jgi:predicted naringenin-chalcone synthase
MVQAVGLPRLARERLRGVVAEFLAPHGLAPEDIGFWMLNPRSPQILDAVGESLRLDEAALAPSWSAWEANGNVISATVFFILDELRRSARPRAGSLGMMLSLGAGVTCEMALLRWRDFASDR